MAFDPKDLEALAASLLQKGLPILGGLIGGPAGAIAGNVVGSVVGQLATALGLPADAPPATINATVQADPNAADKLAALEDAQKSELAFAQLQVDQNKQELDVRTGSSRLDFYYGGWRPAAGWITGPLFFLFVMLIGLLDLAGLLRNPLTSSGFIAWVSITLILPTFMVLIGARSYERIKGVALDSLPIKPRVK